jgi:hypothetical protein
MLEPGGNLPGAVGVDLITVEISNRDAVDLSGRIYKSVGFNIKCEPQPVTSGAGKDNIAGSDVDELRHGIIADKKSPTRGLLLLYRSSEWSLVVHLDARRHWRGRRRAGPGHPTDDRQHRLRLQTAEPL